MDTKPTRDLPRDVRQVGKEWLGHGDLYVAGPPGTFHETRQEAGAYGLKIGWFRRVRGRLTITGERLDGKGQAQAHVPTSGYAATGPLPTRVTVDAPGCWRITGRLGTTAMRVTVRVVS